MRVLNYERESKRLLGAVRALPDLNGKEEPSECEIA